MENLLQSNWIGPVEPKDKSAPPDSFFFPWRNTTKIETRVIPEGWMCLQPQRQKISSPVYEPLTSSTEDLKAAFRTIYAHLHEKHHLDRLVHSLYVRSEDRYTVSNESKKLPTQEEYQRFAFKNTTRVRFPRPTELQPALRMARAQNLGFLITLLTNPGLRFRLCVLVHLLECALGLKNGLRDEEHPRDLDEDERTYVIKKMQSLFLDLFDEPHTKQELLKFLDSMYSWIMSRPASSPPIPKATTAGASTVAVANGDRQRHRERDPARNRERRKEGDELDDLPIPALIRDIFPASGAILCEIINMQCVSQAESSFKAVILTFWTFLRLSLVERKFVCTTDYADAARDLFNDLRRILDTENFGGPAKRLMRTLVNTADQLWEGGEETDSCLAMERVFAYFVQRSIKVDKSALRGRRMGDNIGFNNSWDIMTDFQAFVRSLTQNMAPVPMPGIAWTGRGSEMYLDGMVLEFPNFSQRNIHLTSATDIDPILETSVRHWHLKITGVEIVAKHVQFFFVNNSTLAGRITDVGEMNLRIPPGSLEIEISFTISPPSPRRTDTKTPFRARSRSAEPKMRPASALHDLYSPESSIRISAENRGLFSRGDHRYEPSPLGASAGPPRNGPTSGARIGQQISQHHYHRRAVAQTEDVLASDSSSSALKILYQVLYPNRVPNSLSSATAAAPPDLEPERILAGWVPATGSIRLGRSGRRLAYANRTNVREIYSEEKHVTTMNENEDTTSSSSSTDNERRRRRSQSRSQPARLSHPQEHVDCVALKSCRVEVRKLSVDILKTKSPILHALTRGIMVRQLRQSIEETALEAIVDVIDAVNAGVEHVSSFTYEEFQKRHGLSTLAAQLHKGTRFASSNGGGGSGDTGNGPMYVAMPVN